MLKSFVDSSLKKIFRKLTNHFGKVSGAEIAFHFRNELVRYLCSSFRRRYQSASRGIIFQRFLGILRATGCSNSDRHIRFNEPPNSIRGSYACSFALSKRRRSRVRAITSKTGIYASSSSSSPLRRVSVLIGIERINRDPPETAETSRVAFPRGNLLGLVPSRSFVSVCRLNFTKLMYKYNITPVHNAVISIMIASEVSAIRSREMSLHARFNELSYRRWCISARRYFLSIYYVFPKKPMQRSCFTIFDDDVIGDVMGLDVKVARASSYDEKLNNC